MALLGSSVMAVDATVITLHMDSNGNELLSMVTVAKNPEKITLKYLVNGVEVKTIDYPYNADLVAIFKDIDNELLSHL